MEGSSEHGAEASIVTKGNYPERQNKNEMFTGVDGFGRLPVTGNTPPLDPRQTVIPVG
jgi:hypothetical protein